MDIPALGPLSDTGLLTLEKTEKVEDNGRSLKIGVPKEVAEDERRVAISPSGAALLANSGHRFLIEKGAGGHANFHDADYILAGAEICKDAKELFAQCDLIAKVAPPNEKELDLLKEKQILISAIHLGNATPNFIERLNEKCITGLGFEFIRESDSSYPIVRMMHEVTGTMSIQIAAHYLETSNGGSGTMLGGITGIPPANIVILGGGVIGEWAARTALGYGASVTILDTNLGSLRIIEHSLNRRVKTAIANPRYLKDAVQEADVVVGALMRSGRKSPVVITTQMVEKMKDGSIIVDAVIDQGGCIETSRPSSLSNPTYTEHGVIHYCVPNMPSNAARTSSEALTNVLAPFLLEIGDSASINDALWKNEALRNGAYVYRKHLTKKNLATMFGMNYRDIELLIATGVA